MPVIKMETLYHIAGKGFWSKMAPAARLEHATLCSASKCSNPLSYAGGLQLSDPHFTTIRR